MTSAYLSRTGKRFAKVSRIVSVMSKVKLNSKGSMMVKVTMSY
jgi:hypothetical protein